jgi:hypothetical protein
MTRKLLALLLCLVAAPAVAQDDHGATAIGFTQDGTVFVIGRHKGPFDDTLQDYLLLDARSGQELQDAESQLSPEEYTAWAAEKGNALAPLKTGPKSPDGKRELQVSGKGGRWKDGQFRVAGVSPWTGDSSSPEVKIPPPSKFRFSVKAGKKSWPSADFTFEHMNVDQRVETFWSPDGGRVAYLVNRESATDRMGLGYSVTMGPTQGPRVQVLGVKDTVPAVYWDAQESLERVGLFPTAAGEAKEAHAKTTVFAAKGFEAEAKKAATALGATVAPLTWKPGHDLVVVLGDE